MRRFATICSAGVLALAGVACDNGNGDESAQAFCDLVVDVGPFPGDDELDDMVANAPSEIRSDVQVYADLVKEHGDDPTYEPTDEEMEVFQRLGEWDQENCDRDEAPGPQPELEEIELEDIEGIDLDDLDLEGFEIEDIEIQDPDQPASDEYP